MAKTKKVKSVNKKSATKKVVKKAAPQLAIASTGIATKSAATMLGKKVPELTVPATGGHSVTLNGLHGKKMVLYFYPKDMTPGCTIEGHEFTKLQQQFAKLNTVVYGVSRDTLQSHEKFKEKECYSIDLLADTDETLSKAFQVIKNKNMYGKKVRGIERSTFVVDESGKIIHEWRGVKAEGHAQQVLDILKQT